MGYPQMAISACFGGPLLNILLGECTAFDRSKSTDLFYEGVGLSGTYYIGALGHPYHIHFDPTLLATCIALILILSKLHLCSYIITKQAYRIVASWIIVPMNDYMMSRAYGLSECSRSHRAFLAHLLLQL